MSIAKRSVIALVAAAAMMPAAFSAPRFSDADIVDIKPLPAGEWIGAGAKRGRLFEGRPFLVGSVSTYRL
jgi:hypothetical protein